MSHLFSLIFTVFHCFLCFTVFFTVFTVRFLNCLVFRCSIRVLRQGACIVLSQVKKNCECWPARCSICSFDLLSRTRISTYLCFEWSMHKTDLHFFIRTIGETVACFSLTLRIRSKQLNILILQILNSFILFMSTLPINLQTIRSVQCHAFSISRCFKKGINFSYVT